MPSTGAHTNTHLFCQEARYKLLIPSLSYTLLMALYLINPLYILSISSAVSSQFDFCTWNVYKAVPPWSTLSCDPFPPKRTVPFISPPLLISYPVCLFWQRMPSSALRSLCGINAARTLGSRCVCVCWVMSQGLNVLLIREGAKSAPCLHVPYCTAQYSKGLWSRSWMCKDVIISSCIAMGEKNNKISWYMIKKF